MRFWKDVTQALISELKYIISPKFSINTVSMLYWKCFGNFGGDLKGFRYFDFFL